MAKARLKPAVSATIRRSQAKARLAPGAGRHAVDGGDHRLGHAGQRRDDRVVVLVDGVEELRRWSSLSRISHVLLEVLPGAERPAGAGQHDAAGGRVVGDLRARSSSSSSLVATSRLFIASGRFSVMVATPSVRSRRTLGGVGGRRTWQGSWRQSAGSGDGQAPRQRATKRSAPGLSRARLAREQLGGGVARPVRGQQLGGQARGRRRGTCATRARGGSGPRTPPRPASASRAGRCSATRPVGGRRASGRTPSCRRGEVPGLGRRRVEVRRPGRCRAGRAGPLQHRGQLRRGRTG